MLQRRSLCLDPRERALDIAMGDAKIADIGEVKPLHLSPGGRMIAVDEHPARLPDRRRPEARPGPVRGTEIKRDPGDTDRRVGVCLCEAEKGRPDCKSRD